MATSFNSRLSTAPEEGCKAPCLTVSLVNITLSGEQTVNSTAVVAGDRVLVNGQTDASENGIYDVSTSAWTRAKDWNTTSDITAGQLIPVTATDALYKVQTFTGDFTVGTTEVSFSTHAALSRGVEVQDGSDAVAGVFTLSTVSYTPGANNIEVDQNGQRLNVTTDYTETSTTVVTIADPTIINANDTWTFRTNTAVASGVADSQNITHTVGGVNYNLSSYLIARNTPALFTDGDTTPAVTYYEIYKTANTGATTITDFDEVSVTKKIWVIFGDSNTTIDFTGSGLKGNAGVDWSPSAGDHMTCVYDGTDWYCDISDNTA